MSCCTAACAWRRELTSSAASRRVASSNTYRWRSWGPSSTVTTTGHCFSIFAETSQPKMGGMRCCFISAAASA